ncbi:MAG: NAD(+) synthase [Deltaproteobacteria bacterium]|nr:NAD(+) synthase [Deltaproteobacteria bacterium]
MNAQRVIEFLTGWLADYCRGAGMNGFAIGISGGIDSAVTSELCARTGMKSLLLNMPIYQARDQLDRAADHISRLEKKYPCAQGLTIDLTPVFQSIERALPAAIQDGLTMANTRARIRMLTLYAQASHHRLLVAGTGNKVEDFGIGFFTKYGDGGVDVSPIADLMKTEVYAVGRTLGIADEILSCPSTDGLWPDNRTDESQIGASYPELEKAMLFEESGGDETGLSPREREVLAVYRKFHRANRHKMQPIPCPKLPPELR